MTADMPTRDVWVTPDVAGPSSSHAPQRTPLRQLPTGDFWPAEEAVNRAADAPAPSPKDGEQFAAGRANNSE